MELFGPLLAPTILLAACVLAVIMVFVSAGSRPR